MSYMSTRRRGSRVRRDRGKRLPTMMERLPSIMIFSKVKGCPPSWRCCPASWSSQSLPNIMDLLPTTMILLCLSFSEVAHHHHPPPSLLLTNQKLSGTKTRPRTRETLRVDSSGGQKPHLLLRLFSHKRADFWCLGANKLPQLLLWEGS